MEEALVFFDVGVADGGEGLLFGGGNGFCGEFVRVAGDVLIRFVAGGGCDEERGGIGALAGRPEASVT